MIKKKIFIACPIGQDNSPERKTSNRVFDSIIEPVASELGFEAIRADHIESPGRISLQILRLLSQSDVVIVDLTTLNPNVMYELGIRHGMKRPCVQIAREGEKLPFDVADERTIFFDDNFSYEKTIEAQKKLKSFIENLDNGYQPFAASALVTQEEEQHRPQPEVLLNRLMDSNQHMVSEFIREQQELRSYLDQGFQVIIQALGDNQQKQITGSIIHALIQNPENIKKIIDSLVEGLTVGFPKIIESTMGSLGVVTPNEKDEQSQNVDDKKSKQEQKKSKSTPKKQES